MLELFFKMQVALSFPRYKALHCFLIVLKRRRKCSEWSFFRLWKVGLCLPFQPGLSLFSLLSHSSSHEPFLFTKTQAPTLGILHIEFPAPGALVVTLTSRALVILHSSYVRSQCHLGLALWHHIVVPFCHSPHLNLHLHVCYQRESSLAPAWVWPFSLWITSLPISHQNVSQATRRLQMGPWLT